MCIANLDMDSPNPIVNGSQGTVVEFINSNPLVQFTSGAKRLIEHHIWTSETPPIVSIKQIPLILSWAITIHKAQGVTLEHAAINVGSSIFESGQTYVALSRVKTLDGLHLTEFDPTKIHANARVKEYYKSTTKNS